MLTNDPAGMQQTQGVYTTPNTDVPPKPKVCPGCGRCNHCGQMPWQTPSYPWVYPKPVYTTYC